MKKQIHIKVDNHIYNKLIKYTASQNNTIQECVNELIIGYLFSEERDDKRKTDFVFIDLFAGIGGMRLAFESCGGKCVFTSEWDKYCQKTYASNFGEKPAGDITKIDEKLIPNHDILVAGFPCQPFSIAGVSKKNSLGKVHGFLDKTHGTLFFDIVRIVKEKRPKAFLLENVKNLRSHDKGKTFATIIEALDALDYEVSTSILDGQNYVPQHRERIFIVGFDRKRYGSGLSYKFPAVPESKPKLKSILQKDIEDKYTLTNHLWDYLQRYAEKHRQKGNGFGFGMADLNGTTRTLSARYYKDGSEILIPQHGENPRRLTPRECARLQGFPDSYQIVVSDTQAYKQFGNAVVVPLVTAVAKSIVKKVRELEREEVKSYAV